MNLFDSKGTPFKSHLYVTEVHPITGVGFCEREDEAHIFKVQYENTTCAKYFDLLENWSQFATRQ